MPSIIVFSQKLSQCFLVYGKENGGLSWVKHINFVLFKDDLIFHLFPSELIPYEISYNITKFLRDLYLGRAVREHLIFANWHDR